TSLRGAWAWNARLKWEEERNMRKNKSVLFVMSLMTLLLLPACSINVKKEANGQDKQVDINTFAGGIHVSKQADVSDVGLAVYPGARLKEKDTDGSNKSANVNISGFGYGIKVVALEYESDDAPAKVVSFYKDQLKKYGNVLDCHTKGLNLIMKPGSHDSENGSNDVTCDGESGANIELKVGRSDAQHIVAVDAEGQGAMFSLVYVL